MGSAGKSQKMKMCVLSFIMIVAMILPYVAATPVNAAESPAQESQLELLQSLLTTAKAVNLIEYPTQYAEQVAHMINKAERLSANAASTPNQLKLARLELQVALDTLVVDLQKVTTVQLQALIQSGKLTYKELTGMYLTRIELYDTNTIRLNSIRALNPNALADAEKCDQAFAADPSVAVGMFGMPTLIKDNINVIGMPTTAGSVALADNYAPYDAPLVTYLKESGAVILGKTNLAEFANYFSSGMPNGWSSLGKQVNNVNRPQRLFSSATSAARETFSNPSGSSSGSAVAGAAALGAVTIGTETNGSILSPSSTQSLVSIKPTRGLISRYGVVPLAETYDTAGPMTRNVTDAAVLLTALAGYDPNDETTEGIEEYGVTDTDYTKSLKLNGLAGKRLGIAGTIPTAAANPAFHDALDALEAAGAVIVNRDGPGYPAINGAVSPSEGPIFWYDLKKNMPVYLATLGDDYPIKTLQDIIDFTFNYADAHGYAETFSANVSATNRASHLRNAEAIDLVNDFAAYQRDRQLRWDNARNRIDGILTDNNLDGIISNANTISHGAVAGYPTINIPLTQTNRGNGTSISFTGTAFTEAQLIEFAYVVEQAQNTFERTAPGLADRGLVRNILTNECVPIAGGLDAAIAAARDLTTEERAPFQALYDSSFAIYRDNYKTQMDVDKANEELRTAMLNVLTVDKAALGETVAFAKKLNPLYFAHEIREPLLQLYENAVAVNANEYALPSEVDSAYQSLYGLLSNSALLQSLVNYANMIKDDMDYLAGEKEAFLTALDKAQQVLSNPASSAADYMEALATLNDTLIELNPETNILSVNLKTDAHLVKKGDHFSVTASFDHEVSSNTVILKYFFDSSKFSYRSFAPSDGMSELSTVVSDGVVTIKVMIQDYNAEDLGEVLFSAAENTDLINEDNLIKLSLRCVVKEEDNSKQVYIAQASVSFTTASEFGEVTLIDLSNLIDAFGITPESPDWNELRFFDFNNNAVIDVYDISILASKIE